MMQEAYDGYPKKSEGCEGTRGQFVAPAGIAWQLI
jgi:hypothetical protein